MEQMIKSSMTIPGQENPADRRMIAALIQGAINGIPLAYLEFVAREKKIDLGTLVGKQAGFWVEGEHGKKQHFWGTCISAEAKGNSDRAGHYVIELRPWLWFLSRSKNSRIFQEMTVTDIVKEILGEYGFSGDLKVKHTGTDQTRTYCVQYGETDLNFIQRLLEDEGFYFYFEHEESAVKMVLADRPNTHEPAGSDDKYLFSDEVFGGAREQITDWKLIEKAVTGKVTLRDFDFTKPSSDLTASSDLKSGSHPHNSYEKYTYPGGYSDVAHGDVRASALVEEQASSHQVWSAMGSMLNLNVGKIFEIIDHPRHDTVEGSTFMVTNVTQFLNVDGGSLEGGSVLKAEPGYWGGLSDQYIGAFAQHVPENAEETGAPDTSAVFEHFQTVFEAVKKSKPYRGPVRSKRPRIAGVQTAIVTGPPDEEIAVDKYGRIKVQFHWDRDGKNDDKTSCWVRTMMPWTGKNWGMIALPRIGQEVVIQFEEGDPDRPLCVGMLYNADTMPPYELPGNATRSGVKTNSSKEGGGYNELMFEDKKGSELVRFMAEKDYVQNVQNQAHIKVGYGHGKDVKAADAQDKESMKLEVKNHLDEIVEEGDHYFEVQKGEQTIKIKKDKTETVEGKSEQTVTNDKVTTVTQGNMSETVSVGNMSTQVKMGNISVDADLGKVDITAMQAITLKVGSSEIVVDQMGVTIKGMTVKIEGTMSFEAKGLMTTIKGDAMLVLKGGMTMIN